MVRAPHAASAPSFGHPGTKRVAADSSRPFNTPPRDSQPGPRYAAPGRQHALFRARRRGAACAAAARKLPFQRQPQVTADEFRRQQKQLRLSKQQQVPFGVRRSPPRAPLPGRSPKPPDDAQASGKQRLQLPHEVQRHRAFLSLLNKYEIHDREPEDLIKFEEHLSFAFSDYVKLAESRQLNHLLNCSEARLERCLSFYHDEFGLDSEELRRLVLKYPRVFSYGLDTSVVPRMEFFEELGIHQSRLKKVLMRCPCVILNYDVEQSLQPRVSFLSDLLDEAPPVCEDRRSAQLNRTQRRESSLQTEAEDGGWASVSSLSFGSTWDEPLAAAEPAGPRPESPVAQVILRHPPVLTKTPEEMQVRVDFLAGLGLSEQEIGAVVRKHPQILQYAVERMQSMLDFLDDFGITDEGAHKIVTWFPQVMSLSLEKNVKPKCEFLEEAVGDAARLVVVRPSFLGMSLERRIRPRVELLQSMELPFNMNYLGMSDAKFQDKIEQIIEKSNNMLEADFERRMDDLVQL